MRLIMVILILLFVSTVALAENVVQIATTRDATGVWNNWIAQAVTWDLTVVQIIADHYAISYKVIQTWYFPAESGFIKGTFNRNILGEYAIRWSVDGGLWSEAESVTILQPEKPKAGK